MSTFDPGLFARSLMGGIAQGQAARQHEDALALQLHEQAMREQAVQRQQQQEEAARQAYLSQLDTIRPAPPQFVAENMPAGSFGPAAQLPNPAYQEHQAWRQGLQGAPSGALRDIVGDYQQIAKQQQISEFNENLKERKVQGLIDKIEAAKRMYGHDETTSPMLAAGKYLLRAMGYNFPLRSERHVDMTRVSMLAHELGVSLDEIMPPDPNDIAAAQLGDAGAMSRLSMTPGGRSLISHVAPLHGAATKPPVNPADIEVMYNQRATPAQKAQAAANLRAAGYPANFGAASMGQPRAAAARPEQQLVNNLVTQQDWGSLSRLAQERDKDDVAPTLRASLAIKAIQDAGIDPDEWRLYSVYQDARKKLDEKYPDGVPNGWWHRASNVPEYRAAADAAAAYDAYRTKRDGPQKSAPQPAAATASAPPASQAPSADEAKIRAAIKAMKARGMTADQIKAALKGGNP